MRTPLSTLQRYIETLLLKEESPGREERKKYLETAVRHCKRLTKLVSELLELAKLESDEISLNPEPFNLSELVQDVIQKFHLRARDRGISLVPPDNRDLPLVEGDIGLIERVLENLIENAIHYTAKGGMVALELIREGNDVSVRVKDTGSGIPEEELPHIFNRFHKLDKSRKHEAGHSGLGLAIAEKILELHERTIEVDSVPSAGTTFIFHLPVHRHA
ncbi:MAG: sensor histidine kinase [Desulfatiglandales bacterium]